MNLRSIPLGWQPLKKQNKYCYLFIVIYDVLPPYYLLWKQHTSRCYWPQASVLYFKVYLSVCPSACLSICPSLPPSHLSVRPSISHSSNILPVLKLSVCPSISHSSNIVPALKLSVCLPVRLYLPILILYLHWSCLFVCLPVRLYLTFLILYLP